ncbi:hypothetical protein ACS0TY_032471 [Phlomoides rotata]
MFIQGDDAGSPGPTGKKKRGQHAAGGDKSGRGLRQFSMKVLENICLRMCSRHTFHGLTKFQKHLL